LAVKYFSLFSLTSPFSMKSTWSWDLALPVEDDPPLEFRLLLELLRVVGVEVGVEPGLPVRPVPFPYPAEVTSHSIWKTPLSGVYRGRRNYRNQTFDSSPLLAGKLLEALA
jgi:hypothetical protein